MKEWRYETAADVGLGPVERWRSVRREPGTISVGVNILATLVLRTYLRLYHRLEVQGREHLPAREPFVLIANHSSHLDALVLAAALPLSVRKHTHPVAAGDVFFSGIARSVLAGLLLNALPLDRKRVVTHALEDLRQRLLGAHCAFIIFPEGTRSRDGKLAAFKAGLGRLVACSEVPVIPCHLAGAFEALPAGRTIPRPGKLALTVGRPLRFDGIANDREGWICVAEDCRRAIDGLAGQPV